MANTKITAANIDSTSTGITLADLTVDTTTLVVDATNNRVGIGTASPSNPLHVSASTTDVAKFETSGAYTFVSLDNATRDWALSVGSAFGIYDKTAAATRLSIDASGNVITGSTTANASDAVTLRQDGTAHVNNVQVANGGGSVGGTTPSIYSPASATLAISTNSAERLRVDGSGNVGIGTASPTNKLEVVESSTGTVNLASLRTTGGGGQGLLLGVDTTSSYTYIKNNTSSTYGMTLWTNGSERMRISSTGNLLVGTTSSVNSAKMSVNGNVTTFVIHPAVDNLFDCGHPSYRWDDIRATNGTIQTSDRNDKQDIESLSDAETRVAVAAKGLLRKFRWQSAVEEKGDEARIHFGIIAQDLQDAFTAEGLDASDYAMFCSDTWTDNDGVEQTRLGVRYSELLAFIIAGI